MAYITEDDKGTKKAMRNALDKTRRNFEDGSEIVMELNRVWDKILQDAIDICPKDTGSLARTIRIVKIPLGISLGGLSEMKEITIFDRSIIAGDEMVINLKTIDTARLNIQTGVLYMAMISMVSQKLIGLLSLTQVGSEYMSEFNQTVQELKVAFADTLFEALKPLLDVLQIFMNIIKDN